MMGCVDSSNDMLLFMFWVACISFYFADNLTLLCELYLKFPLLKQNFVMVADLRTFTQMLWEGICLLTVETKPSL